MFGEYLDYNIRVRLPILIVVALFSYGFAFFISTPVRNGIGYSPTQPINFSHRIHAGELKIDCRYCHIGVDKGRHALIPSVDTCMNCHSQVKTDFPEIQKLTAYFKENKPIPWKRIYRQPDYVYFNHSVHVNKGIDCIHCHGPVEEMAKVAMVKPITMGTCLKCHRGKLPGVPQFANTKPGPENCVACHR